MTDVADLLRHELHGLSIEPDSDLNRERADAMARRAIHDATPAVPTRVFAPLAAAAVVATGAGALALGQHDSGGSHTPTGGGSSSTVTSPAAQTTTTAARAQCLDAVDHQQHCVVTITCPKRTENLKHVLTALSKNKVARRLTAGNMHIDVYVRGGVDRCELTVTSGR